MRDTELNIGLILPEVLGTYGDNGNAEVLAARAQWRGIRSQITTVNLSDPIPQELDIYLIGGGEDTAQALASDHLRRHRGLHRAVAAGKVVLAICAGMQVLGQWYTDANETRVEGAQLLDLTTVPQGKRSIGELVTSPLVEGLTQRLTGFENHGGATILGEQAQPFGQVISGHGNAAAPGQETSGVDGCVQGSIYATYMHGPVLARNPQFADFLLLRATGQAFSVTEDGAPEPLVRTDRMVRRLREERLEAAQAGLQ